MSKLWLVIKQDMVLQNTGYIVRADCEDDAKKYVDDGRYIEETPATIMDTVSTETIQIVEIDPQGKEQEI